MISIHALLAESDPGAIAIARDRLYFYPRSPCGERRRWSILKSRRIVISIHALLAESDCTVLRHAGHVLGFLSTLSLRRATAFWCFAALKGRDFYPRSPCGERPLFSCFIMSTSGFLSTLSLRRATACKNLSHQQRDISIHALLAESDFRGWTLNINGPIFLSTLSLRRATMIHPHLCDVKLNFYPRSPCGERHVFCSFFIIRCLFLSTLSLRRATRRQL